MDKIRVFKEKVYEPVTYLRLFNDADDGVLLAACDATGNRITGGNIALINKHGMRRIFGVSSNAGIKLDDSGRIVIT